MKITLQEITICELVKNYADNAEQGVVGYGGKLDIRPPYQREFIYKESQRDAVIDTVAQNFPLNVMYWAVRKDRTYEVLDGQQRTLSICQFVDDIFSVTCFHIKEKRTFWNLAEDERERILDYKLQVYFCEGEDSEKLAWFRRINIAGEKLTPQELRNAVFHGSWLADAKRYFSKNNCVAYHLANKYVSGSPIRQEYLETAIDWIVSEHHCGSDAIEKYMSQHKDDKDALDIWTYFQRVIAWIQEVFPNYRKEMKGLDWGGLYNHFKDDAALTQQSAVQARETQIKTLMMDDDVTKKSGIYQYVLTGDERCLNIRTFTETMKRSAYEKQSGVCPHCKQSFAIDKMEGDHITPWSQNGKTITENCQMLCKECNRRKAGN
ncbi:MAG: DUF262 domain-containing protein [Planctomycetaceae bacterium]|jgi:hypothetical protein|nr:DUF262 domain-containing protein [Planctomycetaceae bacterium]